MKKYKYIYIIYNDNWRAYEPKKNEDEDENEENKR